MPPYEFCPSPYHCSTQEIFTLNQPRQTLCQQLGKEQPIRHQLRPRTFADVFFRVTIIEEILIEPHRMFRVNLCRDHLGLFLIGVAYPTVLPIPVFANLPAVIELDQNIDRENEIAFAMRQYL